MPAVRLGGCAPDTALMYLKSLGAFRAVARHEDVGDPGARARWDGDTFVLDTRLGKSGLVDFFASEYRPLPVVSPWNVLSGFHDNTDTVDRIRSGESERLRPYRSVIDDVFCILNDVFGEGSYPCRRNGGEDDKNAGATQPPDKKALRAKKDAVLALSRNRLPDDVVEWIDAAFVMTASGRWTTGAILGSGGSDGKTEMSQTYMKYVLQYASGDPGDGDRALVRNSLYGDDAALPSKGIVVGHLFPGAFSTHATGPPSTLQYTVLNPWDYILAMEGMTFFGGGVSRRGERGYAAFPFSVRTSWAGHGTACDQENGEGKDSGEVWFPLWDRPAAYGELRHVFYEGLVQSHKTPASGVGMAVALANYGAMRGINAFERYGMFKRKGRDHHLVNVGRIHAGDRHGGSRVLQEIEPWLDSIRSKGDQLAANGGRLPTSMGALLRAADDAIISYCMDNSPKKMQDVLVVLGRLERQIAISPRLALRPLGRLSGEWLAACNTQTPEYRLAASLASVHAWEYPIRHNLEPVKVPNEAYKPVKWVPGSTASAWGKGDVVRNMISVLERRCVDGRGSGRLRSSPKGASPGKTDICGPDGRARRLVVPLGSKIPATVADVVRFVEGEVDDGLIRDLLLPLSAVEYKASSAREIYDDTAPFKLPGHVPEDYISLKANFPPMEPRGGANAVFEPTLIGLLKSGNAAQAVDVARRRLRASGYRVRRTSKADADHASGDTARRLCASLIFPIRDDDMNRLVKSLEPPSNAKKG